MDVLLVRFGALGDVVLTLGATAALRRARPEARITYLVKREYAALVEGQAGVDRVWTLDPGEARGLAGAFALRRRIAAAGFTAKVDWQTSTRSRIALAGSGHVATWRAERLARRRWVSLRWTHPRPLRPAWLRYVDALAPLGVDPAAASAPAFLPPAAAEGAAADFFAAWDRDAPAAATLGIAPGARWATKRWPADRFTAVVAARRAAGERVLLVGDARDRADAGSLAAPRDPGVRWFDGDLPAVAAALRRTRGVLANDSGLLHLAAAVGRPTVAIFASTHPALGFAPAGEGAVLCRALACQPCALHGRDACPRGHHDCARGIDVESVLAALAALPAAAPRALGH
jgi:heptosyltransferase-2